MPDALRPELVQCARLLASPSRGASRHRARPPASAGFSSARPRASTAWSSYPVLLLALAVVLCGTACQAHAQSGPQQARGLITNVQARSIVETEAITLRT